MKINRISTGIPGLDELIGGGLPETSCTLIYGGPGTGKTIFGLQYLFNGAQKDENGLYISFEESPKSLISDAELLGMDLEKLCNENKIKIAFIDEKEISKIMEKIKELVDEYKVKRTSVDSLSTVSDNRLDMRELYDYGVIVGPSSGDYVALPVSDAMIKRRVLKSFIEGVKDTGVTSTMTYENEGSDMMPAFICDGVIVLKKKAMAQGVERTITVEKMRKSEIDGGIHKIEFAKGGLKIV